MIDMKEICLIEEIDNDMLSDMENMKIISMSPGVSYMLMVF